jgi:hypothetical protein
MLTLSTLARWFSQTKDHKISILLLILEHKFLSVHQKCLPMENMHAVVREFELILLEKERGNMFWRIIIKQKLTKTTNMTMRKR